MIFWSSAKRASRESLLEDFLRFGQIFEDFWVSLGFPFRAQDAQVRAQNHFSKKIDFWGARRRVRHLRIGYVAPGFSLPLGMFDLGTS